MRDIRFDFLKLIAMLCIVFIHGVTYCDLLNKLDYLSLSYFLTSTLYAIAFSMTNVFVIASSSLLISKFDEKEPSVQFNKAVRMSIMAMVYSTVIYIILVAVKLVEFSLFELLESVFSVFVNQYWFVGAYIFLYLSSPIIYKALTALSKNDLKVICLLSITFFMIFPSVFIFASPLGFYDGSNGKSIIWMIILFMCTFYIKKYGYGFIEKTRNSTIVITILASTAILVLSRIVLRYVSFMLNLGGDGEGRLFFDSSIFIVLISFCIFFIIIKMKPSKRKGGLLEVVTLCTGSTFGIYLIHNNPNFRVYLWDWSAKIVFHYEGLELPMMILIVCVVFFLCMIFEVGRLLISNKVRRLKLKGDLYDRTSKD